MNNTVRNVAIAAGLIIGVLASCVMAPTASRAQVINPPAGGGSAAYATTAGTATNWVGSASLGSAAYADTGAMSGNVPYVASSANLFDGGVLAWREDPGTPQHGLYSVPVTNASGGVLAWATDPTPEHYVFLDPIGRLITVAPSDVSAHAFLYPASQLDVTNLIVRADLVLGTGESLTNAVARLTAAEPGAAAGATAIQPGASITNLTGYGSAALAVSNDFAQSSVWGYDGTNATITASGGIVGLGASSAKVGGIAIGQATTAGEGGAAFGSWTIAGNYGFAAGWDNAGGPGSFVYSDPGTSFDISAITNGFSVRASGGTYFETPTFEVTGRFTGDAVGGDVSRLPNVAGNRGLSDGELIAWRELPGSPADHGLYSVAWSEIAGRSGLGTTNDVTFGRVSATGITSTGANTNENVATVWRNGGGTVTASIDGATGTISDSTGALPKGAQPVINGVPIAASGAIIQSAVLGGSVVALATNDGHYICWQQLKPPTWATGLVCRVHWAATVGDIGRATATRIWWGEVDNTNGTRNAYSVASTNTIADGTRSGGLVLQPPIEYVLSMKAPFPTMRVGATLYNLSAGQTRSNNVYVTATEFQWQ